MLIRKSNEKIRRKQDRDPVIAIYLGETLTGTFNVALEPCEVTTGVRIKKVWL